ncbi:MAG: hypothetical protein WDN24_11510 [Sphingomonas sp.]
MRSSGSGTGISRTQRGDEQRMEHQLAERDRRDRRQPALQADPDQPHAGGEQRTAAEAAAIMPIVRPITSGIGTASDAPQRARDDRHDDRRPRQPR